MEPGTPGRDVDIVVSNEELGRRELSAQNQRLAVLLLHTRGYVILRGAIPVDVVAAVDGAFAAVFSDCVASAEGEILRMAGIDCRIATQTQAVFWERNHRWRIFPRLRAPFDTPWVLANPLVMGLVRQLLGDFLCKFVSSDTCVAGAQIQSPHREMDPGLSWEPRGYIVNVPLHRCDLDNGPLEIWPCGSHLWRDDIIRGQLGFDDTVQDGRNADFEGLAAMFGSRRVTLEPGDVVIRDPALMHRGTVNHTDRPRTMLTVCYFRAGLTHNYGTLALNLDGELYERLAPEVRPLFAGYAEPAMP